VAAGGASVGNFLAISDAGWCSWFQMQQGETEMKKTVVAMMMAGAALVAVPAGAQKSDDAIGIIDQGMNHSQVMLIAQEMTDGLGPRLTNSPGMRRAEQWAIDKFKGWGLSNVRRDGFEFGRGWEIVS